VTGVRASDLPLTIAQLGSLGCGALTYREELLVTAVDRVNAIDPDLVLVAGDLTADGYAWEYERAAEWLGRIEAPLIVVPGNHDSRNVGYIHFERIFGDRFSIHRDEFVSERAERLGTTGVTVLAVDSSEPDLDTGRLGREWYGWLREGFSAHPEDLKVLLIHHHVVAIPGAGRELNVITDAGDLLPVLSDLGVDLVLSGHKHVPYFWGLNGMLVGNCGTTSTRRLRGSIPPSWNELKVDATTIKVYLHYEDGRRELSAVRSRDTHQLIREAFHITGDFFTSNRVPVH
jgi:3',5'-cyclic-AMP phosphodiesterase